MERITKFMRSYPLSLLCGAAIVWLSLTSWFPDVPQIKEVPFYDKWVHFIMYGGWASVIWWERNRRGHRHLTKSIPYTVLLPGITGGLMELGQAYLTTCRTGDWMDFLANCTGVAIGFLTGILLKFFGQRFRKKRSHHSRHSQKKEKIDTGKNKAHNASQAFPKEKGGSSKKATRAGEGMAVEILRNLVTHPRISREEEKAAAYLFDVMTDLGLSPRRNGNNLWCIRPDYDKTRPTLLLNAHIDTVKPVAGWTRNPFKPHEEAGRLYGLGTNDDGASLVALLQVFCTLPPQSYNLVFLASAEEEVGGRGGVESVLPMLPHIDVGLVGEPTGMQPAIAEKGLMVIDATCHGRSGHAARNEGDNAIMHAMADIQAIGDIDFGQPSPLLGPVKATVTIINAGTQHNVVPAECTYTIDVRSNELHTNEELLAMIQGNVSAVCKPRSTRLQSSHIEPTHPLVKRAVELGRRPFGSPTLSDQALMPFPTMKMGPGNSARSHTADEYIVLAEIDEAIAIYTKLLDGLVL